jgi:hypothetical protein
MINKFKKDKIKKIVQKKVKANKSVKAVNKKLLYGSGESTFYLKTCFSYLKN